MSCEVDLLPCPFCGGAPKRHDIEAREDVDNAGASYIECGRCGACTQLHFDRKENLLDSWNRRSASAEAALAACRETVEVMHAEQVLWWQTHRTLTEEIERHQRNLRHWREECGKLHAKLAKAKADLQSWEITAKRIAEADFLDLSLAPERSAAAIARAALAGVAEQSGAGAPETSVRCGAPAANKTVS